MLALFTIVWSGSALADGPAGHGLGVGIEAELGELAGPTVGYDLGRVRLDLLGKLSLRITDKLDDTIGGGGLRCFVVVHHADRADFAVGVGAAVLISQTRAMDGTITRDASVDAELAAELRAFVVSNVALTAEFGIALVNSGIAGSGLRQNAITLGGQLLGGLGVMYYFE
jgi:hypothetical protein